MRQIELHREDPSIPLVPPPNPFTKFLERNFRHINFMVNMAVNLYFLVRRVRSADPLTRNEVLAIALFMNLLFFTMVSYTLTWNNLLTFKMIDACREVIDRLTDQFVEILGVLKDQTGVIGDLAKQALTKNKPPKKR